MGNIPCKGVKTIAMKNNQPPVADIALIGLAVMGQNLILNMNDNGWVVCAFNRTVEKVEQFLANEAKGTKVVGATSLQDMVAKLKKPRRVMLLVKAGSAVDAFIDKLVPLLESGDIIIDGGNSEYQDTQRRCVSLKEKGLLFVGSGVSGGEEGARYGPSLMPGGHKEAWPHIKPIFQSICAKSEGEPCCDWVGDEGAGHYVKMVHNGIEYGDMQLICEAYHVMKTALGMGSEEISEVFSEWNKGELDSFLIEITANIFKYKDESGEYLVEKIRDAAGQKGTGKWTAISSLEYGTPVTLIAESVFARCLSAIKDERVQASKILEGPSTTKYSGDKKQFIENIRKALYASKIVSYAQGFMLLREAADKLGWTLNYGGIALMWRGGCIIRSRFLGKIKEAFDKQPLLSNLLLDSFFIDAVSKCQEGWREVVAQSVLLGVPTPALSSALAFYDGYRSAQLPANLIQAQRDYFGAHTYELLASPGKYHHTNWTGTGGNVSSSTYQSGLGGNARKKAEALQLQIEVTTDEEWEMVKARKGLLVVDVYSSWCGPCTSMTHTLRRIKLELGDDHLTMVTAQADTITDFEKFRLKAEPTWLFFGAGKALRAVHGADGPKLVSTLRELLDIERKISKGQNMTREVVMLDSLLKPEEVLQPDEDLDDIEGERLAREEEEGPDGSVRPLPFAVVFIMPFIISNDKVEAFLSHMVASELMILGHVQQELTVEDLQAVLLPSPSEQQESDEPTSTVTTPRKEPADSSTDKAEDSDCEDEEELQKWAEELTKAPLYMLLLRVEEGSVVDTWYSLLGPPNLEKAKTEEPDSLVSLFGEEGRPLPAWMPRGRSLQNRLANFAFPSFMDANSPKLLLLPDGDHQQVLESLCASDVAVLAHTQAVLSPDIIEKLCPPPDTDSKLQQFMGKAVFAAVLSADSISKLSDDLEVLHLTGSAGSSDMVASGDNLSVSGHQSAASDPEELGPLKGASGVDEIALFFPDLSAELMVPTLEGPNDDPQTQMQIEQRKEKTT